MAQLSFSKNEIVLCLALVDKKWYKAKIVGINRRNTKMCYEVHYHGWNDQWDEWVTDTNRLCKASKNNDITKQLLADKNREQSQLRVQLSKNSEISESDNNSAQYTRDGKVCILPLSSDIQTNIYNQCKLISEKPILLIKLPKPSNLTIHCICTDFIKSQTEIISKENKLNPTQEIQWMTEIIGNIRYLFNTFIEINILWDNEKAQKLELIRKYAMDKKEKIDYCNIYGSEHLFRLLWNLPNIYAKIKGLSAMQASKVSNYVSLFNGYLSKHISEICVEFDIEKNPNNDGLIIN